MNKNDLRPPSRSVLKLIVSRGGRCDHIVSYMMAKELLIARRRIEEMERQSPPANGAPVQPSKEKR